MNLQICFVNDSGSDKDSDADDSKTETSLDTPLSPMVRPRGRRNELSERGRVKTKVERLDCRFLLSRVSKFTQTRGRGAETVRNALVDKSSLGRVDEI